MHESGQFQEQSHLLVSSIFLANAIYLLVYLLPYFVFSEHVLLLNVNKFETLLLLLNDILSYILKEIFLNARYTFLRCVLTMSAFMNIFWSIIASSTEYDNIVIIKIRSSAKLPHNFVKNTWKLCNLILSCCFVNINDRYYPYCIRLYLKKTYLRTSTVNTVHLFIIFICWFIS